MEEETYRVEFGTGPSKPLRKRLEVTETPDEIVVASTAMRHRIRRDGKPLLTSIAFKENEFLGAPIRIAHTDPECDVFLGNPDEFLRTAILNADRTAARIERLRGLRAASDPCYGNPGLVVRNRLYDTGHKRLAAKYEKAQYMYAADAWGILQALSLTRSPSLILAASRAVSDEFFDLTKAEGLLGVLLETLPAPKKPRKGAPKPQHNQPHPRW